MAWIESHQSVWEHAKTRKAARRLGIPTVQVVGHLQSLWHWAVDHAEDGNLSKYDPDDIAIAARWEGDPDEFVEAMIACGPGGTAGFLERGGLYGPPDAEVSGDLVIHDWWDYAGKLIAQRQSSRDDGIRGNHKRHHAAKGVTNPDCPLCESAPEPPADPPPDSGGDRDPVGGRPGGRSGQRRTNSDQPTNQPTTSPPDGADPDVSEDARALTRKFALAVKANGHPIPTQGTDARDKWLIDMDRLLRLGPPGEGGVVPDPDEVSAVIDWCAADEGNGNYPGESVNVRSVKKLRGRYSELRRKAGFGRGGGDPLKGLGGV